VIDLDVIDLVEAGEAFVEQGDIPKAYSKFEEALKLAPEDPQLYNRLGILEMARGKPAKALIHFTGACQLAPDVSRYHMRLGDSLQRLEKYEEAIQAYARSLDLEPKNAPAWNNRGFANFNINRWNEALRCYDESMRSDPSYAVAWYNYGYTLQLSGRLNDSKDYYQRAVELDPDDKIAWNNLANVHYNQGHYERSIEIYKKSIELDSNYVIAINNIGNALDHLHKYEESIPYHEKAIELDPTFHYAWMAKGRALTKLGSSEEGLEFIETSIELDNQDPDYHEALARCFVGLGLFDKARQILNLGLSVDGQHVPCWIALGDVNYELNNHVRALQCYDEAVRAQDILSRSRMRDLDWMEKGKILLNAGVMHEGFRQYSNAVNVASGTSRPYFKKAEALIKNDLIDEAKKAITTGLEIDPGSITGYQLLVRTMTSSEIVDDLENLVSEFPESIQLKSLIGSKLVGNEPSKALEFLGEDNWEDLMLRVRCYRSLEENENALVAAIKSINLRPENINGWIAAGWCAFDIGKYDESSDFFDSAMGCDMYSPDALLGKASVLEKMGRDNSIYSQALAEIDPDLVI
jgi:superkiller protein 3